ncbi:MAG TPA: hypothetical protein VEX86_24220 [Longimicrobium sp.]|nr:hypothetical protein [Longimicrobium sp.]
MPTNGHRFLPPGFWNGVGRVLDLAGGVGARVPRSSLSPAERDARALAGDWAMVGGDMRRAMQRVAAEVNAVRRAAGDGPR